MLDTLSKKEKRKVAARAKAEGVSLEDAAERFLAALAKKRGRTLQQELQKRAEARRKQQAAQEKEAKFLETAWTGWFDGATEPTNPGHRGIGALLISPQGERFTISENIGFGTNNEAEYLACIALLEKAVERGAENIIVRGDSMLVINQITGEWGVNSERLDRLATQAKRLISRFRKARISWTPREQNREADALSKQALGVLAEPRKKKGDAAGTWGTQTDIGKKLGISAIAVGRFLDARGMRDGKHPSEKACTEKMGRRYESKYGTASDWNIQAVVQLYRTAVAEAE